METSKTRSSPQQRRRGSGHRNLIKSYELFLIQNQLRLLHSNDTLGTRMVSLLELVTKWSALQIPMTCDRTSRDLANGLKIWYQLCNHTSPVRRQNRCLMARPASSHRYIPMVVWILTLEIGLSNSLLSIRSTGPSGIPSSMLVQCVTLTSPSLLPRISAKGRSSRTSATS